MSLIQSNYTKHRISHPSELDKLAGETPPAYFAFDTETDGIFHMVMKPFLIIFGWVPKDKTQQGVVTLFEPTPELMGKMYEICSKVKAGFAHNAKFDLHAVENIYKRYPHKNIIDTMTVARLLLPAMPLAEGGDSLGLKQLADKYIEKNSSDEQKVIKKYKAQIGAAQRKELETELIKAGFSKKQYNKVMLETLEADPTVDLINEIPKQVYDIYKAWDQKYPRAKGMSKIERVSYKDIWELSDDAKQAMEAYAYNDVIYTLEIAKKFMPIVRETKQMETLLSETNVMYAFYKSERVGIKVDLDYVKNSKVKFQAYIQKKRDELQALLGTEYSAPTFAASPKQIKDWLTEKGMVVASTSKDALEEMAEQEHSDDSIAKVIKLVVEIRKLIKKFSTDLNGYLINTHNGRRYTTFNMNGAVTGRISNDMQQMPNAGIEDDEGNELFHPRKAVVPTPEEGYSTIAYLDYSQVEVRIQAHYSWIAMNKEGDINLLRVFVPFKCYTEIAGQKINWDPENRDHVNQDFIQSHKWLKQEDGEPWEITDLHLLTAQKAFPEIADLPKEDPKVQKMRKQAKGVNFAIQYGAGIKKIIDLVGNKEEATKLFNGNKEAFQGLVAYADMLRKQFNMQSYVENAYGRKYKLRFFSHKLMNYVIQGTGAEILKRKLLQVDKLLSRKKSRIIHNIHDEIQFEIHDTELDIIPQIKAIMENTGDKFIVPIVSDVETTTTNWFEKVEI